MTQLSLARGGTPIVSTSGSITCHCRSAYITCLTPLTTYLIISDGSVFTRSYVGVTVSGVLPR